VVCLGTHHGTRNGTLASFPPEICGNALALRQRDGTARVPVQAPLQPANAERFAGVAFNVTTVPPLKAALHALPQLIPPGLELTVPEPVPPHSP